MAIATMALACLGKYFLAADYETGVERAVSV